MLIGITHKKIFSAWDLNKKAVMNFITREETIIIGIFLFSFLFGYFLLFVY